LRFTRLVVFARAVPRSIGVAGLAGVALAAFACSACTATPAATTARSPAGGAVDGQYDAYSEPTEIGPAVRYVVQLGDMRMGSGLGGAALARVLHDSARTRARALKDAAVIETSSPLARQAADRHLPIITIDGLVTELTESPVPGGLQVRASVEFSLRRDQVLRATVTGAATAGATSASITDRGRRELEGQAIDGAVLSALGRADRGFMVATR
jgi:hypothetical protein